MLILFPSLFTTDQSERLLDNEHSLYIFNFLKKHLRHPRHPYIDIGKKQNIAQSRTTEEKKTSLNYHNTIIHSLKN